MSVFDKEDVKGSVAIAVSTVVLMWIVIAIFPKLLAALLIGWGFVGYLLLVNNQMISLIPDNPVDAVINWVKAFTWPAQL